MTQALMTEQSDQAVARSFGTLHLSTKKTPFGSGIERFRTSGATKVAFPRRNGLLEAIVINTSGGLTGGDRYSSTVTAGADSRLILTTQAAERGYKSVSGTARIKNCISASSGSALHWLPQEIILFEGACIERQLSVDVHRGAELLLVEPIVFGRMAMGEALTSGTFRDTITIRRDERLVFWDRINLNGPIFRTLDRPAIAGGMRAIATTILLGPRAETLLPRVRKLLPRTGGASLVAPDLLIIRLVASDGFKLRRTLMPVLELLASMPLPKSWSL